jgi:hypothetical protein
MWLPSSLRGRARHKAGACAHQVQNLLLMARIGFHVVICVHTPLLSSILDIDASFGCPGG